MYSGHSPTRRSATTTASSRTRSERSAAMPGTAPGGPRRTRLAPYLLVAPGVLWLVVFFVVPIVTLVPTSVGSDRWYDAYARGIAGYGTHFLRSVRYGRAAPRLALAPRYPHACHLAFRAGRLKHVLLGLVMLPFFTTFLVRTFAWKTSLSDGGPAVWVLRHLHLLGDA